jgi:glycosyltransferase involved in cell wall biosynthesis
MHIRYDGNLQAGVAPFFSVCIPQHNRTSFIVEAISWLGKQTFRDFEICISDDCSTDGRESEVIEALRATGLPFTYKKTESNLRYDGNTRASIDMSSGRYCYLMGNDDRPATVDEFQLLHDDIVKHGDVGVVISNFYSLTNGKPVRRMVKTGIVGAGPWVAAANYRNFGFVTGVVLDGPRARALSTNKWDGSEMYQMHIGSRIIAEGKPLLSLERVSVAKDIQIPGEMVDSMYRAPRVDPCPIIERKHTLHFFPGLVYDAVEQFVEPERKQEILEFIVRQMLIYTYAFWILEYRRVQSWKYAAGIALGMRPRNIMQPRTSAPRTELSAPRRARVGLLYGAVTLAGLAAPLTLYDRAKPALFKLAKSARAGTSVRA